MLKPFTYAIGTFIGIGVLVLPFLFQEVGVILATFGLLAAAFLLLLLGFIVFDLVGKTKKDLPSSVEEFLTWSKPLVRVSLAVFTYGALVAYVMGAGQQLFALFGGQIQYWGTLFFVLAAWPVIQNSHIFDRVAIYLSLALLFVIALLVPFNMAALNVSVPAFGSWAAFPFLLSVSIFALFGHPSIYEITKMRKKESEARYNFFGAFFVALLVYLAYAITSVSVGPMSDLSTVSLLFYHSSGIGYVISLVAILAFYTSFVNISEAFMNSIK
ncbi:MAG: hypothetical protein GOV00_01910, partial [Candidatus Altiarchaeota archaeon]|nr:hypothetical protein [Candidatus Altiarchaeota archaeon]